MQNPPAVAQPAAQPAVAVPFARTPAAARLAVLNYDTAADAKIFTRATAALPTVFSIVKPNITILLSELLVRAQASAWVTLLTMTIGGQVLDFLLHYGRVSLTQLKAHVNTFIDADGRTAQNDYQLYLALSASICTVTKEAMTAAREFYVAGLAPVADMVDSGLLFLKKLLMIAEADTRATTAHARDNLINLDTYMSQLAGSDIREFHIYVRRQYQTLTARGETTHDLIHHLFKGYNNAKCDEFVAFMKRKKDDFRDGTIDFTPETLMLTAENKFNDLSVEKNWTAVSAQEQLILALRAQVAEKVNKRKPGPKDKDKPFALLPPAERFTGKMAWKAVPPATGSPGSKTVGKTVYHWCPNHSFWTVHKPSECTLAPKEPVAPPTTPTRRTMTFAEAAAAAVAEGAGDEAYEDAQE